MFKTKQISSNKSISPVIRKNISFSGSIVTRSKTLLTSRKGISPNTSMELKQEKSYINKDTNKNKSDASLQTCILLDIKCTIIQTGINFKSVQMTNELLSKN